MICFSLTDYQFVAYLRNFVFDANRGVCRSRRDMKLFNLYEYLYKQYFQNTDYLIPIFLISFFFGNEKNISM